MPVPFARSASQTRPTFSRDFAGLKTLDHGAGPAITFTRASNATFFDASGTLRFAPSNAIRNSQAGGSTNGVIGSGGVMPSSGWFSTASGTNGITIELLGSGTENGLAYIDIKYSGTPDANVSFSLDPESSTQIVAANGQTWTHSNYLKLAAGSTTNASIQLSIIGRTAAGAGVAGNSFLSGALTITSTLSRYSLTSTFSSASVERAHPRLVLALTSGNPIDLTLRIAAPQLERNATPSEYIPTTGTANFDQPRFDHDPATGASRGLLIEEARTNLLERSEEFGTTWSAVNSASVTSNTSVAPSGQTTADTLTAAANNSYIQQAVTFTGDGSKAISLFIKAGTSTATEVQIRDTTANASRGLAAITWTAGVPSATVTGGSLLGLTNIGSGWYRLQVEAGSVVAANTNNFRIAPDTSGGNGNILIWGAQAENGAFATSYIPTTTAAATRSADSAVVTPISSFYNQSEGTLFAEGFPTRSTGSASSHLLSIGNSGTEYLSLLRLTSGTTARGYSVISSLVADLNGGSFTDSGKLAMAYRQDDFAFSFNGGTVATDTSGNLPTADRMRIGSRVDTGSIANGHIRKIAYYPRRLSNALLQQLTT